MTLTLIRAQIKYNLVQCREQLKSYRKIQKSTDDKWYQDKIDEMRSRIAILQAQLSLMD